MISLIIFLATPLWLPLLFLYMRSWNKYDPYYQDFVEKYGEDELRRMSKLIK